MNIHQNARLTPLGRERMVRAVASAFYRDVRGSPFVVRGSFAVRRSSFCAR